LELNDDDQGKMDPRSYNRLMQKWLRESKYMDAFARTSYAERFQHVCTEQCDILCDPIHAKGIYLCTKTGRVHTCDDGMLCELELSTKDGHTVCAVSGRVLHYDDVLSDSGHYFKGSTGTTTLSSSSGLLGGNTMKTLKGRTIRLSDQRSSSSVTRTVSLTAEIAAQRFWERDEQKTDDRLKKNQSLRLRAREVIEHLLFSPTRMMLRNRYRETTCREIAESIVTHIQKAIPSHRFIDFIWIHSQLQVKLVHELRRLRAYDVPSPRVDLDTLIDTSVYLWLLFLKYFCKQMKKNKYLFTLHVQIVLFCMIHGIEAYGLPALANLESIAPLESDLDQFGYEKTKFTHGEEMFRHMLSTCYQQQQQSFFIK
jgi:hypothetical protein